MTRGMILVAVMAIGCGGSSDSATQSGDCGLDISISGGYSWKNADAKGAYLGCGSTGASGTSIGVEVYGPDEDLHQVRVLFLPALPAGTMGDTPVTVVIDASSTAPSVDAEWRSAVDGCNFKITRNQHEEDDFFENKYIIAGTVECAAELTQSSGSTTLGAVNVNNFKFQSFDDYAP